MQLHLLVKCPFATEKNNTEIDDFQDEYISLFNPPKYIFLTFCVDANLLLFCP